MWEADENLDDFSLDFSIGSNIVYMLQYVVDETAREFTLVIHVQLSHSHVCLPQTNDIIRLKSCWRVVELRHVALPVTDHAPPHASFSFATHRGVN